MRPVLARLRARVAWIVTGYTRSDAGMALQVRQGGGHCACAPLQGLPCALALRRLRATPPVTAALTALCQ